MTTLSRGSTAGLVRRILEQPDLVETVQGLDARVLGRLIEHVGLEDAGEIVALATTEQLERVFDDDLWQSKRPGQDESFDAGRFGLWLEILLEAGEQLAVDKVAAMDEDFLALGLLGHVFVLDLDAMALEMSESPSDERDLVEKALEGSLYEEIEEYRIIARDTTHWDAIVTILLALDRDHHALLQRILERCCAATTDYVEDNGSLYDVLTSEQMLDADVAAERETRRERQGFVAPSAAASFLRLARSAPLEEIMAAPCKDPITKAHFRAAAPVVQALPSTGKVQSFLRELAASGALPDSAEALPMRMLQGRSEMPRGPSLTRRALSLINAHDAAAVGAVLEEVFYLVNVLMSVSRGAERPLRAVEAMETVTAVCDLGLAKLLEQTGAIDTANDALLQSLVKEHGLVKAFRVGWRLTGDEQWTAHGLQQAAARAASLT